MGAIDEATKYYLRARENLEDSPEELERPFQGEADERALGTLELDVTVKLLE